MTPAVSVIVATYNYGEYLSAAVESVLAQTFPDFELLIVDDGSTDDTPAIAQHFLADRRVRYFRREHAGQPATKNFGIEQAAAPLLAFLDADDLWYPNKLQRQVELLRQRPEVGLVAARRTWIDPQGNPLVRCEPALHRGKVLPEMFCNNFVCFSSVMLRRSLLDEIGRFDESLPLAIDYDLWLRAARRCEFDYVDEPLVWYRTGHANLSRNAEQRLKTALGIMRRFLIEGNARNLLPPRVVRRAFAETYAHLALAQRDRSRAAALQSYLAALYFSPCRLKTWRDVISLVVPEFLRRKWRQIRGQSLDWREPLLQPPSSPAMGKHHSALSQ